MVASAYFGDNKTVFVRVRRDYFVVRCPVLSRWVSIYYRAE